jgi:hypothetical protein
MDENQQESEPTQLTQPKGIDPKTGKPYKPVEIPIPTQDDFEKLVRRATERRSTDDN